MAVRADRAVVQNSLVKRTLGLFKIMLNDSAKKRYFSVQE